MTRGLPFLAALALVAGTARAQSAPVDSLPLASWVGEHLAYEAKFGILNVGTAEMQVVGIDTVRGTPTMHLRFLLEGGPFFYRLHDVMESWVGLDDFASRRFVQDFDEGGRKRENIYQIYPDSGFYRQEGVDSTMPTSTRPLDDAAFFYFVRTLDLTPGKRYALDRYFKPDRNPVVLEVLARDTIDVPAGRFPCVVVRPIIKGGGIFKEGANGRMWITDDARRIVAQIQTKFAFGSITLRLTGIQHDSTAR
ncbi:MAG TPA: DUF3108 domain-containing protein [Gemmatimonadales bacterium]|nr:DUF3108 domain-containing protein [Gemmatimonadales bacterium]